ncbi:TetR family transcriptional regulator [Paenibacillus cellulosilyticus]|uniref:TetR family transcriptional regulator n=1 Tax=Paenibacillus cellulosilyticus TaxID=375489 RepID=A0A2V2YTU2_9BACL|nr:TetR/AcrR family transcriptional regulator [Paenibacillus cellulosilyticus]PWV99757.1 TetR family transcriptional regulator [Paenibacillus cellulosilyticus]QKS44819.1 TetR/AcrR family transcriptional regulator [Paenibacillus cellulosilyticus]
MIDWRLKSNQLVRNVAKAGAGITQKERKSKKTYDAARTRELILDAAEQIFAEQGFSAARIDAIASASGYNKSLIYQYFTDKLGLYMEVVKRADQLGDQMLADVSGDLLNDEQLTKDAGKFRLFLETVVRSTYDFLVQNPRFLKIYSWEAAEGWKTWNQIAYRPDDITQFYNLAKQAKESGLIRVDLDPYYLPILLLSNVGFSMQHFARFNIDMTGDIDGESGMGGNSVYAREQLVKFVVYGLMEPSLL